MSNRYRNKINRFRSKAVKRWLGMGIAPGDHEFYMSVDVGREADAAIATLTAERDELKKQVRELVEAWEQHDKARDDLSGAMESDPDYHDLIERVEQTHDRMTTLSAQLKEQDQPDLSCPGCGGPTEISRDVPPSPYYCEKCEQDQMEQDDE